MKDTRHIEANLQHLLRAAYRARTAASPAPGDGAALMRRIAGLPRAGRAAFLQVDLERLFWRLAPTAGVLIVVMAVLVFTLGVTPASEIWPLWNYNAAAAAFMQNLIL
jgi:hypothetical protein